MLGSDGFQLVKFEKERERVFAELIAVDVVAAASDGTSFQMRVLRTVPASTSSRAQVALTLQAPAERPLKNGESLEIVFGLREGQYVLKTKIIHIVDQEIRVEFSAELYRLQRRNNFRVKVARDSKLLFRVMQFQNKTQTQALKADLQVDDLSAGGIRVFWTIAKEQVDIQVGHHVRGVVALPNGQNIEVFGEVKNVNRDARGARVGLEFNQLSSRDEQALLLYCVKIGRDTKSLT